MATPTSRFVFNPNVRMVTKDDLLQASKAIHDQLMESVQSRLDEMETGFVLSVGKMLEGRFDKRLDSEMTRRLDGAFVKHLESLRVEYAAKLLEAKEQFAIELSAIRDVYREGVEQIKTLLQSIPAPQVTLPADAIRVEVEQKGTINVAPAVVENHVHTPKQPAPIVENVVNVPSVKPMRKHIEYDDHGRPVQITEREVE